MKKLITLMAFGMVCASMGATVVEVTDANKKVSAPIRMSQCLISTILFLNTATRSNRKAISQKPIWLISMKTAMS